jgi:hypothetical protein
LVHGQESEEFVLTQGWKIPGGLSHQNDRGEDMQKAKGGRHFGQTKLVWQNTHHFCSLSSSLIWATAKFSICPFTQMLCKVGHLRLLQHLLLQPLFQCHGFMQVTQKLPPLLTKAFSSSRTQP